MRMIILLSITSTLFGGVACRHDALANASPAAAPAAAPAAPSARAGENPWWRDPAVTNDYYLSAAHILIGHRKSDFRTLGGYWPWKSGWAPPDRSREEARALAESLRAELSTHPERFEESARRQSSDVVTRDLGGKLGVIRASNLPLDFLDAYSPLADGQVSTVFETAAGFHLLRRLPVPPEETWWARRITIKYPGAAGWVRPGRNIERSREAALALAKDLASRLRETPAAFPELAESQSDDVFASVGGALGPRSNRQGTNDVATWHALSTLPVGGVSDVLDEAAGYVIVQRMEPGHIERRAFRCLAIPFAPPPATGRSASRPDPAAHADAIAVAKDLATHPARFDESKRRYPDAGPCAAGAVIPTDGSSFPTIHQKLAMLAEGDVGAEPEEAPFGYLVFQRVAVPPADESRRRFDLGR
jgi:hypothetical protein